MDESGRPASRALRVDEAKIDALIDLAGELIVAKNGIAHLAKRLQDEVGDHELARVVRREHDAIERLTGEMHAAILQLRMVPVAQVFRSFPRLVRDMSHRLEKNVRLVTVGETTESDKAIVDSLFEPLLHLVRNALDHGIESPEQRRTAGKAESATITMRASRAGDRFIVEVIDDGRGIDPAAVRRRALERGRLAGDALAALPDDASHRSDLLTPAFRRRLKSRIFPGAGSEWTWCGRRSSGSAVGRPLQAASAPAPPCDLICP